jgi:small subunit ribosomal protein S1
MSRSNKDSSEEGWQRFAAAYQIGDVLDGTVASVVPFGTFVEIGDAVHGLLLDATLTVGERVRVRVADIDADKHRVGLTIE